MNLCHQDKLYIISENQDITIYKNNEWKTYSVLESVGQLKKQTFCVLNYIKVINNKADEFESKFIDVDEQLEDLEGFVALRILRPQKPDDYYLIITLWDTELHFKMWYHSHQYQNAYRNCELVNQYPYKSVIDPQISYRIKFNTA
ncbi:antibiotic biosynthesis monooxygenase family protein [Staphylococcus canis]|uniref:Signal transduction protein TRAP n=1 Tax=Staphylococcus canis TaxID=2724942 RepID=A0ABS0T8J2_9STAP|nr:antibiotic biosynthesis monooxygenase [Staphylococcus canis]MBI5975033.1 antibiotic biosynthesis monooxygenase [Staphylococcus canis]